MTGMEGEAAAERWSAECAADEQERLERRRQSEESTDDILIRLALTEADMYDAPVSHSTARLIASQHHDGMGSALYAFVSNGCLLGDDLARELARTYTDAEVTDKPALYQLMRYVTANGDELGQRPAVEGWDETARWDRGDLERSIIRKFGRVATPQLVARIERAEPFSYDDEQYELSRRLRVVGRTWQWSIGLDGREVVEVIDQGVES